MHELYTYNLLLLANIYHQKVCWKLLDLASPSRWVKTGENNAQIPAEVQTWWLTRVVHPSRKPCSKQIGASTDLCMRGRFCFKAVGWPTMSKCRLKHVDKPAAPYSHSCHHQTISISPPCQHCRLYVLHCQPATKRATSVNPSHPPKTQTHLQQPEHVMQQSNQNRMAQLADQTCLATA